MNRPWGIFMQSGGTATEFVYYASQRGIRFSRMIRYGNALDIDEIDVAVAHYAMGGPFSALEFTGYVAWFTEVILEAGRKGKNPIVAIVDRGRLSRQDFEAPRWQCLAQTLPRLTAAGIPIFDNASEAAAALSRVASHASRRSQGQNAS